MSHVYTKHMHIAHIDCIVSICNCDCLLQVYAFLGIGSHSSLCKVVCYGALTIFVV